MSTWNRGLPVLKGRPLPSDVRLFMWTSLALTAICASIELFCKFVLHLHYPYNFPLLNPGAITQDLLTNRVHFSHLHHLEFFDEAQDTTFTYPAPMAIPYAVFFVVPSLARPLFYIFSAVVVGTAATMLGRKLVSCGLATSSVVRFLLVTALLSYPLWFELKQGNMEIVVFVLIASGVWSFLCNRGWTAASCFGVAASMKFFPIVFLGLFVARKQYLKAGYSLAAGAITTVASLWMIFPSIPYSWHRINSGVSSFRNSNVLNQSAELGFDHSLWSLMKRLSPGDVTITQLSHLLNIYFIVVALFGLCLYFVRIRYLPLTNQVLCLTTVAVLITPMSFDYTLIHLYTPLALLVLLAADPGATRPRGLRATFLCLGLLCSPLSEFIDHHVTFQAQIRSLLLICLLLCGLAYPFSSRKEVIAATHAV